LLTSKSQLAYRETVQNLLSGTYIRPMLGDKVNESFLLSDAEAVVSFAITKSFQDRLRSGQSLRPIEKSLLLWYALAG
jgi:hypothetical protein